MVPPGKSTPDPYAGALLAAMTHPIKAQILAELGSEESQSAAEVAERIDAPVRSVRHQLSRLAADGLVEMIASRGRRGALEKLYRVRVMVQLETADFEVMSAEDSRRVTIETFRRIVFDVTRALVAGTFDWNDSCEIRIGAEVDEEGWTEIAGITRLAYEEVEAARSRAAGRLERSKGDPKRGTSVLLWFERPTVGDPEWTPSTAGSLFGRRLGVLPEHRDDRQGGSTSLSITALAKAMGHPVRAKILSALSDTHPLGVGQIAGRIHEPKRRVRYHVGRLMADGLIEQLRSSGRTRTRYALLVIPFLGKDELEQLTDGEARRIWTEIFRGIVIDVAGAISSGTFYRRPDFYEVRQPLVVDAEGWEEVQAISSSAYEKIESAHAAAAGRLAVSGAEPIAATAAILWFEVPPA